MNEVQLYAKIGRLQTALEAEQEDKAKVLKILAEVVSGECERSRLMVNLTDGSVTWAPPGERPAMPCTINGLPVCVVAPPDVEPSANGEPANRLAGI